MKKSLILFLLYVFLALISSAQDANVLLQRVKEKLDLVNNYEAKAVMKTDISFLRVPQASVSVYFKKPDKIKIENEKGISFVPKGAVTISLNGIIAGTNFTIIDAGKGTVNNTAVRVLKLLPNDESGSIILSTVYIDEKNAVILKAITTTKDNGTYELTMQYVRFLKFGLPDSATFIFNMKDYKMPKGVTFDYDDTSVQRSLKNSNRQGMIEIKYTSYAINKGVNDAIFK